jgi:hypothetical protein
MHVAKTLALLQVISLMAMSALLFARYDRLQRVIPEWLRKAAASNPVCIAVISAGLVVTLTNLFLM